jgi:hypothetical protein
VFKLGRAGLVTATLTLAKSMDDSSLAWQRPGRIPGSRATDSYRLRTIALAARA